MGVLYKNPVDEILLVTPILRNSLSSSKLSNPINPTEQETFIEPKDLRDVVIGLNEPSHEVTIPMCPLKTIGKPMRSRWKKPIFQELVFYRKMALRGLCKTMLLAAVNGCITIQIEEITFQLNNDDREELTVSIEKIHVDVNPLVKQEDVTFEVELRINATINGFKGK